MSESFDRRLEQLIRERLGRPGDRATSSSTPAGRREPTERKSSSTALGSREGHRP
jgi:hypothetical protein